MALSDLIAQIEKDAKDTIARLEKEYAENHEQLKKEYKQKEAELKASGEKQFESEAEAIRRKNFALADMESKRILLEKKREIVEEAYKKAVEGLKKLPEDKQVALLSSMLTKLAENVDKGKIYPAKGSKSIIKKAITKSKCGFQLEDKENSDITGGFILKTSDMEVDSSYESIVAQAKSLTQSEVISELF